MGRRCAVCDHPEKAAIEEALLLGKQSISSISSNFGLSRKSVGRHKRNHLKAVLPAVADIATVQGPVGVEFEELITDIKLAKAIVWQIVDETLPRTTERRDCLAALRQIDGKVELLGKLQVARMQQLQTQRERQAEADRLAALPEGQRGPIPIREVVMIHPMDERVRAYIQVDDAVDIRVSRRKWAEFESWERRVAEAPRGVYVDPKMPDYEEGGNGHGDRKRETAETQGRARPQGPASGTDQAGDPAAEGQQPDDEQVSTPRQKPDYHESFFQERSPGSE